MRQARWTRDGIAVIEVEMPTLRSGWVRLRVLASGICGTDLHLYRREIPPAEGTVPGHEMVGVPLEGPRGLAEGLYAVEPRTWCGECELCDSGSRHLCASGRVLGLQESGGLADFVDVPRQSLHPLDPSLSPIPASLAEPFAVAVRAVHLAQLDANSRVLVLGAGSIGLLTGLLARERAARVAISGRHPHQRAAAQRLGLEALEEAAVEEWGREFGPDAVIETVGGRADTLGQAVHLCRPSGRVVVLGLFVGPCSLNAMELMAKEITLIGSNTYGTGRRGSEFAAAVELLPRYGSELQVLQTHRFGLASLDKAFDCAAHKEAGAIKVTVVCDDV